MKGKDRREEEEGRSCKRNKSIICNTGNIQL